MVVIEQAGVVPVVIVVTQVLKSFKEYYKFHGLVAFVVALLCTAGVSFYNMPEEVFNSMTLLGIIKFLVESLFMAVATWLSAAKIYDLSLGKKKKIGELKEILGAEFKRGVMIGNDSINK